MHVDAAGSVLGDVPVFDDGPFPSSAISEADTFCLCPGSVPLFAEAIGKRLFLLCWLQRCESLKIVPLVAENCCLQVGSRH
jgi:hypothetical protein